MDTHQPQIGTLIRDWRQLRRLSQLDLALEAEISQKHLSFIESGRSRPSRDMVLLLAEHLGVPLRERNALLLAAGYAPVYLERALEDPGLQAAQVAIDLVLKGHEPYPALADRPALDAARRQSARSRRCSASSPMPSCCARRSMCCGCRCIRADSHPSSSISAEWRAHLLARLRQQIRATADPCWRDLLAELLSYPAPTSGPGAKGQRLSPRAEAGDRRAAAAARRRAPCSR